MQKRVVLLGIIVENTAAVEQLNILLHAHNEYIIGRMGLPYKQKGINIISIVLDAPADVISTLSGQNRYAQRSKRQGFIRKSSARTALLNIYI